jgi:hypothetical protein
MVSMQHKVMIQFDHFVPWNKATFSPASPYKTQRCLGAGANYSQGKNLTINKQFQQTTMEGFSQEHVIGIPLSSFAYADEKTQRKPTCSSLVRKKGNDLTIFFPISLFPPTVMCMPLLISILGLVQIRRTPSSIG